jgi:HTH-type transcriptional regulator/antitoxin HigA
MENFFESGRSPGQVLRALLNYKGWTQEELAIITNKSRKTIMDIISDKSGVSPDMAVALSSAFGNEPSEWLAQDSLFRLSRVDRDSSDVQRRAHLFQLAPIREMQRRGWIKETSDPNELEAELKAFFCTESLEGEPQISVATRRSDRDLSVNAPQRAWCFRARTMASTLQAKRFTQGNLEEAARELRNLAAYPKEARHLPYLLAEYGIRFVVVEPLPGAKIDGAAFWIDETSPVIAVSVRFDRIDSFWFTVMHEFVHIQNHDALSVDEEIAGESGGREHPTLDESERIADEEAASLLISQDELYSFIHRVGPLYSRDRVIQFAHRIGIHPGIIVGQLQRHKELGYKALRDLLVKIRSIVIEVALTDGWGRVVTLQSL